ncbi:MAG TPA: biotin transporter BioY [Terracidiphilus sp.]|nr:biotin transporter BioY [Terracidiphilus sp.]
MNKELTTRAADFAGTSIAAPWLRNAGIVLAASVLLATCAHIALPLLFTPVPLTLQPFAVLLLGLLLSPRMAGVAVATYLAEGALGLPVFAPTAGLPGGIAHLFGPTGGYLMAYPAAAVLIAWLRRRIPGRFASALAAAAAGDLLILLCGALWLTVATHAPLRAVLPLAVLPFLPGDALKVAAAAGAATGFRRLRRQNP